MKEWRRNEAARLGTSESNIAMRLKRGKYPHLRIRRENPRIVFVSNTPIGELPDNFQTQGVGGTARL